MAAEPHAAGQLGEVLAVEVALRQAPAVLLAAAGEHVVVDQTPHAAEFPQGVEVADEGHPRVDRPPVLLVERPGPSRGRRRRPGSGPPSAAGRGRRCRCSAGRTSSADGSRWSEKKLSRTSRPGGGKTLTVRRNRLVDLLVGVLIVAVEAITLGRTFLPFTSQVQSWSMAVSYRPTSVPSGPLIRCSSSWMIRSGGRSGGCSTSRGRGQAHASTVGWKVGVLDLRRLEPVALAVAVDLAEEHLDLALPRHLGELVHRGDQQRRQPPVDLLVHHDDRQALVRRPASAEEALAELVAAVDQRAARPVRVGLGVEVLAGLDGAAAPRAGRQLVRRADAADRPNWLPRACLIASTASSVRLGVVRRPTHRPMRNGVLPQRGRPCSRALRRIDSQAQIRAVARWNCWIVSSRSVYRIRTAMPSSPDRPATVPCSRRRPIV